MALYDAKIEKFSKKAEQLERNIKRDTDGFSPKSQGCVTSHSAKS